MAALETNGQPTGAGWVSRLDGCYVLKTDLPPSAAATAVAHARYKDLAQVEQAFRTCKTAHLEARPLYVRAKITHAHTS